MTNPYVMATYGSAPWYCSLPYIGDLDSTCQFYNDLSNIGGSASPDSVQSAVTQWNVTNNQSQCDPNNPLSYLNLSCMPSWLPLVIIGGLVFILVKGK